MHLLGTTTQLHFVHEMQCSSSDLLVIPAQLIRPEMCLPQWLTLPNIQACLFLEMSFIGTCSPCINCASFKHCSSHHCLVYICTYYTCTAGSEHVQKCESSSGGENVNETSEGKEQRKKAKPGPHPHGGTDYIQRNIEVHVDQGDVP